MKDTTSIRKNNVKLVLLICFIGLIYGGAKHLSDSANGVRHSFGEYAWTYLKAMLVSFLAIAILILPVYIVFRKKR